jgi:hypothetical protein
MEAGNGHGLTEATMDEKQKKKTAVAIHQFYVVRQQKHAPPVVCSQCPVAIASLVAPDEAAVVTGISTRAIYRWVEAGVIHFLENANGSLLVCLNSFPAAVGANAFRED